MLRPALPYCPALPTGSSLWKAVMSNQRSTVRGPLLGLATRLGRLAGNPWTMRNSAMASMGGFKANPESTLLMFRVPSIRKLFDSAADHLLNRRGLPVASLLPAPAPSSREPHQPGAVPIGRSFFHSEEDRGPPVPT